MDEARRSSPTNASLSGRLWNGWRNHATGIAAARSPDQVEAIRASACCWKPSDPATPVRSTLADVLRDAVEAGAQPRTRRHTRKGMAALDASTTWQKLKEADRARILGDCRPGRAGEARRRPVTKRCWPAWIAETCRRAGGVRRRRRPRAASAGAGCEAAGAEGAARGVGVARPRVAQQDSRRTGLAASRSGWKTQLRKGRCWSAEEARAWHHFHGSIGGSLSGRSSRRGESREAGARQGAEGSSLSIITSRWAE